MTAQVIYGIISNLFFIVVNLPLFIYFYLIIYQGVNLYLFLMYALLIAFSFSLVALFETIYQLVDQEHETKVRFFWQRLIRAYSKDSLPVCLLICLTASIGFAFFQPNLHPLLSLIITIYAIVAIYGFFLLPFVIMETILFKNSFLKTWSNALILSFQKWELQVFSIIYFLFCLVMIHTFPAGIFFIGFSGYCYLFLKFYYAALQERISAIKGLVEDHD